VTRLLQPFAFKQQWRNVSWPRLSEGRSAAASTAVAAAQRDAGSTSDFIRTAPVTLVCWQYAFSAHCYASV